MKKNLILNSTQHVMLLLKIWISYAIPDIPSWVATEMAKIEWKRRESEKTTRTYMTPTTSLETIDKSVQTEELSQQEYVHLITEHFPTKITQPLLAEPAARMLVIQVRVQLNLNSSRRPLANPPMTSLSNPSRLK